jgi:hypothetical protein
MDDKADVFEVEYGEVARYFEAMKATNGKHTKQAGFRDRIWKNMQEKGANGEKWYGASVEQTLGWINTGYHLPGLSAILNMDRGELEVPRRRLKFSDEEGELQVDLALSGHDQPLIEWERRTTKRGIRIVADISMSCMTKSSTIKDYLAWLVRTVVAFEERGETVELAIAMPCTNLGPDRGSGKVLTIINLKGADEAFDVKAWTAMFSPAGMRHLGFTALYMHGEAHGFQCNSALGYPVGTQWSCEYDETTATLNIGCPSSPNNFNELDMTRKLEEALSEGGR